MRASTPWLYRPSIDLIVGCGAWSAPLLLIAYLLSGPEARSWAVGFYALAIVFNYPHFMATIYRAYGTVEDFRKYRVFTQHITLCLLISGAAVHMSPAAVAWLFTLYITWSPWHYAGQNYGLLMMFVRRNGGDPTAGERRALYTSFVASYVMLFLVFHSGTSVDPFIRSIGIPPPAAFVGQLVAGACFVATGGWALWRLIHRIGLDGMMAPLTLYTSQVLWFVLPTALEIGYGLDTPHRRYSSGILAILHAAQYLWVTGYYARREAGNAKQPWRPGVYYATLVVGGIALFIPGPWIVSYAFAYDLTTTFMVFTAVVNIHHFILDGAIWKLRDGRIAALLIDSRAQARDAAREAGAIVSTTARWLRARTRPARLVRAGAATALLLVGVIDLARYVTGSAGDAATVEAAVRLNPYDSAANFRLGTLVAQQGNDVQAEAALREAVMLSPAYTPAQHALGRLYVERERYDEAYVHYDRMLQWLPGDVDALTNHGLLARQMGLDETALASWRRVVALEPYRGAVQLAIGNLLAERGDAAGARPHYETFLGLAAASGGQADPQAVVTATLQLAAINQQLRDLDAAATVYETAATMAGQTSQRELESVALGELGTLETGRGAHGAAAEAFQRAIALDRERDDALSEAVNWVSYGQLLEQTATDPMLALACFARAEELAGEDAPDVRDAAGEGRARVEAALPDEPPDADTLDALLTRALALPPPELR